MSIVGGKDDRIKTSEEDSLIDLPEVGACLKEGGQNCSLLSKKLSHVSNRLDIHSSKKK